MRRRSFLALCSLSIVTAFTGCQTTGRMDGIHASRIGLADHIRSEPPGDYYIGRRYFKKEYKFWGYVRRPGQPWSTAQMVMMNEHSKLAPDRELGKIGFDNGYEYKLYGNYSGESVYEPASNRVYPEFVLKNYELRSTTPPAIFRTAAALDPSRRVIERPY